MTDTFDRRFAAFADGFNRAQAEAGKARRMGTKMTATQTTNTKETA